MRPRASWAWREDRSRGGISDAKWKRAARDRLIEGGMAPRDAQRAQELIPGLSDNVREHASKATVADAPRGEACAEASPEAQRRAGPAKP